MSCKEVAEIYISLFDPSDHSMNLTVQLRENIYKYTFQTNLFMNMARLMLHPKKDINLKKYNKKYKYESRK